MARWILTIFSLQNRLCLRIHKASERDPCGFVRGWHSLVVLLALECTSICPTCIASVDDAQDPAQSSTANSLSAAFKAICEQQDAYHKAFIVYDDRDSGNENFFPSGWMGNITGLQASVANRIVDGKCLLNPHDGFTCLKIAYPKIQSKAGWGGIFWEFPETNACGVGYYLEKYRGNGESVDLRFWLRGERGGEYADIGFRNSTTAGQTATLSKVVILSRVWEEFSLSLNDLPLNNVTGGFSLSTLTSKGDTTIFADNIRVEFGPGGRSARLNEPHFVRSYVPESAGEPDKFFRNACYSYDNSLMVIAFCARGREDDLRRAGIICRAFLEVQEHDSIGDGRIRNGYACGNLLTWNGDRFVPRLPGWWDDRSGGWIQDSYCAGTDCGNMAWVALAMLDYWEKIGSQKGSPFLTCARRLCEWIYKYNLRTDNLLGYSGGVEITTANSDNPKGERWATWKSTEHNIDIYVAFLRLASATGNTVWKDRAEIARKFVWKMVDGHDNHLWTGTGCDGVSINMNVKPLDVNPWALMAFRDAQKFEGSINTSECACHQTEKVGANRVEGFDFKFSDTRMDHKPDDPKNVANNAIWWEGTAQMQIAFAMLGYQSKADRYLDNMRKYGMSSGQKGAMMATLTKSDGLATGFRRMDGDQMWIYWKRPHIGGATCWYIFSELHWNPYWGRTAALLK